MSLNVKLVVVGGDVKTAEITLKLPSTIGRGRGVAIVLPHPLVSRQHCELFESDGQLMVKDLGSLNGTFVNNQRVTEAPVGPEELLTVGTVTFRAVYEAESGASPSAPTVKTAPGEKTVKAPKAATVTASPKHAGAKAAESDSGPLEFNFEQPLLPADEDLRPTQRGASMEPTERLNATVAVGKQDTAGKAATGKTASSEKSPANKPADAKTDASKWEEETDDEKHSSSSDDDLNDFLQSLGDKDK
jgi:PPE-repeat protein